MHANPTRRTALGHVPQRPGTLRLQRRFRRGISLVEVVVVMAVLILGMLAIARLFPEGFASLNQSANSTITTALIKGREDEYRLRQDNLPDGVVGIDPTTGAILTNLTPQTLLGSIRQYPIPSYAGTPPDDPRFTGSNIQRRVLGEQFLIPPPSLFAGNNETASLYRVLFSPIYCDPSNPSQPVAPAGLGVNAICGTPTQRIIFEEPPSADNWLALEALGPYGYGINYETAKAYFVGVPDQRIFRIEYSYRASNNAVSQTVPDNCIFIDAGTVNQHITYDLRMGQSQMGCVYVPLPAGAEMDQNSDYLYRRFQLIPTTQAFSATNAFEFKVYDTYFGLFGFNPRAATLSLPSQRGRGLTAKLDYDVDDWHILRQDENVPLQPIDPDGNPGTGDEIYTVKLQTPQIKQINDTEGTLNFVSGQPADTNSYEYQGLMRYYPDTPTRTGTPGVDLVVVDLDSGYQIDSRTLQRQTGTPLPGSSNTNGEIDYNAGVINLRATTSWLPPYTIQAGGGGAGAITLNPAGRRVRVYYRASSDFAVATFKPYVRYHVQPTLPLTYRTFSDGYGGGYLLFPPMDAEKSVAVDYTWQSAGSGTVRTESGELHQIAAPGTPFGPTAATTGNHWWVRLARADADPSKGGADAGADSDVVPGSIRVTGVRGASLHTHVSWLDGKRIKHRQRSTLLTRDANR